MNRMPGLSKFAGFAIGIDAHVMAEVIVKGIIEDVMKKPEASKADSAACCDDDRCDEKSDEEFVHHEMRRYRNAGPPWRSP